MVAAYLYLIKIRVLTSLAYRFELIFALFKQIIFILLNLLLWKYLYNNKTIVSSVSYDEMLTFTILVAFLNNVYVHGIEGMLRSRIRKGDIAIDYIKPINIFAMFFADDLGVIVVNIMQRFVPLLILYCIFVQILLPISIIHFIVFLISVIAGFLIIWLLSAIFGLLYFWIIDLGPLGDTKDYIVAFLSGSMIPLWFFSKKFQEISAYLPFKYTYQAPIDIFIGKTSIQQALFIIVIQMFWCLIFYAIFLFLSEKASRIVMVQGG